jgi:VWFA-related protein
VGRRTLPAALVAVCLGSWVAAEQGTATQQPQFRARVDVVELDVSVIGKDEQPVKGLTASDFTVLENGQPQKIIGLREVDIPPPEAPPSPWMRDVAPDVRTNQLDDARLFVILMDDAMMVADARLLRNAKDIARKFVARLQPSDLAAVVFTRDNRHAQDFTNDRALLLQAIEKFSIGFYLGTRGMFGGGGSNPLWKTYSIRTISRVAKLLGEIPHRRKAVVYISIGVPLPADEVAAAVQIGSPTDDVAAALHQIFRGAQLANASIYTVDPMGLDGLAVYLARRGGPPEYRLARAHTDYLETVAALSGGEAIVRTNDFEPGLDRIIRDNSSYYLVSYESPAAAAGKSARLDVRVTQPGTTVRARTAWVGAAAAEAEVELEGAALVDRALASPIPGSDIPMQVVAMPFARPGAREALVGLVLRARQELPAGADGPAEVEVLTRAFSPEGRDRGIDRRTAALRLVPNAAGEVEYELLTRLALVPGRYSLRLALANAATQTRGSVYTDVTVPDFAKAPLSLSGVMLTASNAPRAAPTDLFADVVPEDVVPTTRREFRAADRATAFARVYQGGSRAPAAVSVTVRIVDAADRTVAEHLQAIPPEQFGADRAADIRYTLPLTDLSPGPYLLTIETTAGEATARRDVRFEIADARRH